jgi:endonuclease/exonuclease/phosphatase family metal-dependent hydrolase
LVSTQRLRIVTFNIAHGRGLAPIQGLTSVRKLRSNLRRISDLLEELGADIVALQEIDECSVWAGSFDHLDYIRAHAGYSHAVFGINNRRSGLMNLCYGNAFLSRFPITDTETIVFGRRRVGEKGFLFSEIDVGGRVVPIVNLHLHFGSRNRRLVQLDLLVAWLKEKEKERGRAWAIPPIVCGDFNNPDTRDDATSAMLSHLGEYGEYSLHPLGGLTFPSPMPRRALDFVFVPPGCKAVRSEVIRSFLSDHRPVMVEFSVA